MNIFFFRIAALRMRVIFRSSCEDGNICPSCPYVLRQYPLLFHVRGLESILNTAWSTCCRPGRWISFDEQMVVNKGRFGKVVQRHLPNKTIKHGKSWVGGRGGGRWGYVGLSARLKL